MTHWIQSCHLYQMVFARVSLVDEHWHLLSVLRTYREAALVMTKRWDPLRRKINVNLDLFRCEDVPHLLRQLPHLCQS
jgi:hypothetical protein